MTDQARVARYYDERAGEEYQRLAKSPLHEAEFRLTLDLIDEYIHPGSRVLDVGAGPGRYAEYLMREKGCRVGLVDLSETSLAAFRERIGPELAPLVDCTRTASATDLDWVPARSFDAVLLMGPLYHLTTPAERAVAAGNCRRILKPGGYLLAAFLSPYPLLPRILERDPALLEEPDVLVRLLKEGTLQRPGLSELVEQFRCWPSEARRLMESSGFTTIRMRNLEGIGTFAAAAQEAALTSEERRRTWFELLRRTCELPDLLGATIHFLYVGRKG